MAGAALKVGQPTASYADVVRHFVNIVWSIPAGKLMLTVWSSYFVWLGLAPKPKQSSVRRKAKEAPAVAKPRGRSVALSKLLGILKPYGAGKHGLLLAVYTGVLSTRILITVQIAQISGRLSAYMTSRRWDSMFRGQAYFGLWCMLAAFTTATMKYFEKRIALSARTILYNHMRKKFLDRELRYYKLRMDDSPARLTTDLTDFSKELAHTFGFMLKPGIDVVYLTATLINRIGLRSVATFYAFFIVASQSLKTAKRLLPRNLKECAERQSELESTLREQHSRLHTYREQIALQKGTQRESKALLATFTDVRANLTSTYFSQAIMDVLNSYVLKYGGMMCAFSVLIEPVYRGRLAHMDMTAVASNYLTDVTLLGTLAGGVSDLQDSLMAVPRLRGLAERVWKLESNMRNMPPAKKSVQSAPATQRPEDTAVRVENLSLAPPARGEECEDPATSSKANRVLLFKNMSFTVKHGEHTVVRGPNGVGKTSLFRALGELWEPVVQGSDTEGPPCKMTLPHRTFIVPQDCYFPTGTLGEQVTYPDPADGLVREEVHKLFELAGLDVWRRTSNTNNGGEFTLESTRDWTNMLSGGQKQRLSWVRLFYRKPDFALIDEGTSAVDQHGVQSLYSAAKAMGITLLTISHHASVDAHHSRAIDLSVGGTCQMNALV